MSSHRCPTCGAPMVARDKAKQTPEQTFCGNWFDHPPVPATQLCARNSILEPSPELLAQHASCCAGPPVWRMENRG